MKPVSETPTEPTDYAAISLVFGSLLAGLAASARSRDPIPRAEVVPLSAATFSLSRLIVHDKAESWLREPFVAEEGDGRRPKGRRLRYAIGELMSCTRCMGAWSALALVGLRLHAPTGRAHRDHGARRLGRQRRDAGGLLVAVRPRERAVGEPRARRERSPARRRAEPRERAQQNGLGRPRSGVPVVLPCAPTLPPAPCRPIRP